MMKEMGLRNISIR